MRFVVRVVSLPVSKIFIRLPSEHGSGARNVYADKLSVSARVEPALNPFRRYLFFGSGAGPSPPDI